MLALRTYWQKLDGLDQYCTANFTRSNTSASNSVYSFSSCYLEVRGFNGFILSYFYFSSVFNEKFVFLKYRPSRQVEFLTYLDIIKKKNLFIRYLKMSAWKILSYGVFLISTCWNCDLLEHNFVLNLIWRFKIPESWRYLKMYSFLKKSYPIVHLPQI
jgi:hypothetical protein